MKWDEKKHWFYSLAKESVLLLHLFSVNDTSVYFPMFYHFNNHNNIFHVLSSFPSSTSVGYFAAPLKWVCVPANKRYSSNLDSLPANFGHLHPAIVKTSCEVEGPHPDACHWKQMQRAVFVSATPLSLCGFFRGEVRRLDNMKQPPGISGGRVRMRKEEIKDRT